MQVNPLDHRLWGNSLNFSEWKDLERVTLPQAAHIGDRIGLSCIPWTMGKEPVGFFRCECAKKRLTDPRGFIRKLRLLV
jgi:hypothetical protein